MRRRGILVTLLLVIPALFACNKKNDDPVVPPIVTTYYNVTFNNSRDSKTFNVPSGTTFREILKDYNPSNESNIQYWTLDNSPVAFGYEVTNNISVSPKFIDGKALYFSTPEDNSIVGYEHTALPFVAPVLDTIEISCSPKDAIECEIDKTRSAIQIRALPNVNGEVDVTIFDKTNELEDSIKLEVHCPNNINEIGLAFDYVLVDGLHTFETKFNFSNNVSISNLLNEYVETRGMVAGYYGDIIGTSGNVSLNYASDMASVKGKCEKGSKYYCENYKNAAYLNRTKNKQNLDSYPYESRKKELVVWNTESLFFAFEHGFCPVIDTEYASTSVTDVLNKAKDAYSQCVCDDEYWTIRTLYEWLLDNTHYDYWVIDQNDDWNQYMSYFAEGVFLNNGVAVCDGFSKALTILAGIGDIPVIRGSGFSESGGHAWNYYCADDYLWYLICPTWGHSDFLDENASFANYHPFLAKANYFYYYVYDSVYNQAIEQGESKSRAEHEAKESAIQYSYEEKRFPNISRAPNYYKISPYKNDFFTIDGVKCDYDITSEEEANRLFKFMDSIVKDTSLTYSIDLTFDSFKYLSSGNWDWDGYITRDYSYYNCTVIFCNNK